MKKQRKSRIKPYLVESFTNKKGHVINPGDAIIIVSSHYKSVSIETGRYLGKRPDGVGYNSEPRFNVVVEVDLVKTKTVRKDDESVEWTNYYNKIPGLVLPPELPRPDYSKPSKYGWNTTKTPEDQAKIDEYNKQWTLVRERGDLRYKLANQFMDEYYKEIQIPYKKISTLQLNRIFPFNLGIEALRAALSDYINSRDTI